MTQKKAESINPNALNIDEAALLLTKAGGTRINESTLRSDVEAGAPTNPDGTLNLVHYAAWIIKESKHGD